MNRWVGVRVAIVGAVLALVGSGCATWIERVDVDSNGAQPGQPGTDFSISADGRYVAFVSLASNLVPGDTNGASDVFVRDRVAGTTTRVSVDSNGAQGNGDSGNLSQSHRTSISADGRYVAFSSVATNLVPNDTNGLDVFVRDRVAGTTTRVSVDSNGAQASGSSLDPSISADGRYVAFQSNASNLVPGDTNRFLDVFVRDRVAGTTTRVSVDSSGAQADNPDGVAFSGNSGESSISADGRYVAFNSGATNLVQGDTNGFSDVFVRDRVGGTTTRLSVDSNGAEGDYTSFQPSMSADGRYVAFTSYARNLAPGQTNLAGNVYVRDRVAGTTTRVTQSNDGVVINALPSISGDGRYVAFRSDDPNLVPKPNRNGDVFVRDRVSGTTTNVNVSAGGAQGNDSSDVSSISADGRYVAFGSFASNLVPDGGVGGVYVRANPSVTLSAMSPKTIARGVATSVTLTGTNFRPGLVVSAGAVAVSNVVVVNESTVTATFTPSLSLAAGTAVSVVVTLPATGGGPYASTSLLANAFTVT